MYLKSIISKEILDFTPKPAVDPENFRNRLSGGWTYW
jgi:hypothetical protein